MATSIVAPAPTPAPQTPAQIISGGMDNLGWKFVGSGGSATRVDDNQYAGLQSGMEAYNKAATAAGQPTLASVYDYDKMVNPTSYTARWAQDGTKKTYTTDQLGTPSLGGGSPTSAPPPKSPSSGGKRGGIVGGNYTPWNVTSDQTVEGRLQSIINPNNPIIASARADAIDEMNARGLSNSTLATTAADKAAYQAAIPIASQDAATAAKASGYNSDIQNQMSMQDKSLASSEKIAQLNADTTKYTAGLSADTQKAIAALNADTQKTIAGLDNASRLQVQQLQNDNQKLLQTNSSAATAFNQAMVAVANIEQSTTMDGPAKTAAIAQIMQQLQMQLKTIGAVAGIDLSGTLNFANMPGFDASGKWVGLPAAAPAQSGGGGGGSPAYIPN